MDDIANKNQALASVGLVMDAVLDGSFKVALDGVYRDLKSAHKRIAFLAPAADSGGSRIAGPTAPRLFGSTVFERIVRCGLGHVFV